MPRTERYVMEQPSLWQRVLRSSWFGPFSLKNPPRDPALLSLFGGSPISSGVAVNESAALGQSAFFCALTTISADVASLPLVLLRRLPNGGKERYDGHPLYRLLHDAANPEMTSFQCRETLMLHALIGNAYAEIERDGAGRPKYLWPIAPDRVTPFRDGAVLRYRVRNPGGRDDVLAAGDVFHLRGPSPDGIVGHDLVQIAREAIGLSIAAERFGGAFFGNGTTFGGGISVQGTLNDLQRQNLREALNSQHRGVERAHKFMLLEAGATYTPFGTSPRDSQFGELRTHQIREIARFFKIPPSKLGDLADATFSNVEQMNLAYFTSCLRPWLERIEQELTLKLVSPSERNIQVIEHVVEGFLRADVEKRGNYYAQALAHGWLSVNEIREMENRPPIEGGDRPRVPMNTEFLGESAETKSLPAPRRAIEPPRVVLEVTAGGSQGASESRKPCAIIGCQNFVKDGTARNTCEEHMAAWRDTKRREEKLERVKADTDAQEQRLERDRKKRLDEWMGRRRKLDTIAQRWPSLANDLRRKGWADRTAPSRDDKHVEMLAERAARLGPQAS